MSSPATARPEGPTQAPSSAATTPGQGHRVSRGLLLGLPSIVLVAFLGWVWWWKHAKLDDIEKRQLDQAVLVGLLRQHLELTAVSALLVLATAIPLGVALTRPRLRHLAVPVTAFANAGQAAPVVGVIVLLGMWLGFGFWTAVAALSVYAFLPVLRNTIVGLQGVDRTLVEAARGMGMSNFAALRRIELPMAAPVIMAGARTALVLLVGTATLATFISAGGLGDLITSGINLFRYSILVSGALLVAFLALVVEWLGRVAEALLTPKGLS